MIQRIADNDRSAHGISKAYYVIDPTQAERQQRDMSALLLSRRCPACVERVLNDKKPPTVRKQIRDMSRCCAQADDFIRAHHASQGDSLPAASQKLQQGHQLAEPPLGRYRGVGRSHASYEHNRGGYEANPGLRQLLLLQGVDEQGKGAVEEEGRTQVRVRNVPPPMAELGRTTRQDGRARCQTRSLRV